MSEATLLHVLKACSATKRDGTKCRNQALPQAAVCAAHRRGSRERQAAAGRRGGVRSGEVRRDGPPSVDTLAGRWGALQLALTKAIAGDAKGAAAIVGVVRAATELRQGEGAELELEELHRQVRSALGRKPIDAQRLGEPLALMASPTEQPESHADPLPTGRLSTEGGGPDGAQ